MKIDSVKWGEQFGVQEQTMWKSKLMNQKDGLLL